MLMNIKFQEIKKWIIIYIFLCIIISQHMSYINSKQGLGSIKVQENFSSRWSRIGNILNSLRVSYTQVANSIQNDRKLSRDEYLIVYNQIYDLCTNRKSQNEKKLYEKYCQHISQYLQDVLRQPNFQSSGVQGTKQGNYQIKKIKYIWDSFRKYLKQMKNIFIYIDRYYVIQSNQIPLEKKGLIIFQKIILNGKNFQQLESLYFQEVTKLRRQKKLLLAADLNGFIEMITEIDNVLHSSAQKMLQKIIIKYIKNCKEYFENMEQKLQDLKPTEYLNSLEQILNFEEKLMIDCLAKNKNLDLLHKQFTTVFLKPFKKILIQHQNGFIHMFHNFHIHPLKLIYKLYKKLDDFQLFKQQYSKYIQHQIGSFIKNQSQLIIKSNILPIRPSFNNHNNNTNINNFNTYFNKILFLRKLLKFNKQKMNFLNEVFPDFLNLYKINLQKIITTTNLLTKNGFNFIEVMLISIDGLIRKQFKDIHNNNIKHQKTAQIKQILSILSCQGPEAKKQFLNNYCVMMSRRLIQLTNKNRSEKYYQLFQKLENIQKTVLQILQDNHGTEETKKIELLLNQYRINLQKNQKIMKMLQNYKQKSLYSVIPNTLNLKTRIFSNDSWSFKQRIEIVWPKKLQEIIDLVLSKCQTEYKNKKFTIDHLQSKLTIAYTSQYQIQEVLLVFNNLQASMIWFLFNLAKKIIQKKQFHMFFKNVKQQYFYTNLELLSESTLPIILQKRQNNIQNYQFNFQFKSSIKIIDFSQLIENKTSNQLQKKIKKQVVVQQDRSLAIEGAIIKIMKNKKSIKYDELVQLTQKKLNFFNLKIETIKPRIQGLINRDFIQRDEKNENSLKYII